MRAARFHEYGPPEVLRVEEVADPVSGAGEVLVRVAAAGVSYFEVQVRAGVMHDFDWAPDIPLPYTPGIEVAGTVAAVGPGVDAGLVGQRVLGNPPYGGYAELAVVPAAKIVPLPDGLDDHRAIALLGQGATAVGVIDTAAVGPDDTVLVEAAGGGIGTLLVQLAKRAGARVVAAASGAEKLALARRLGADVTVDYSKPGWGEQVGAVSVVLETVGGEIASTAFRLIDAPNGRMVIYGFAGGSLPEIGSHEVFRVGAALVPLSLGKRPELWPDLARRARELAIAGELEPVIGAVLPLAEAAKAHQSFEDRTALGKTILTP